MAEDQWGKISDRKKSDKKRGSVEADGSFYAAVSALHSGGLGVQPLPGSSIPGVSRVVYGTADTGVTSGNLFCGIPLL